MIIEKQKGKQEARQITIATQGIIICQKTVANDCKKVHELQAKAKKKRVHFQLRVSANYPITRPARALVAVNVTPVMIPYYVFESPRSLIMFENSSPLLELE